MVMNPGGEDEISKVEDVDLLDLLGGTEDSTKVDDTKVDGNGINTPTDEEISEEIKDILGMGIFSGNSGNKGSGDVVQDLANWITDDDKMPSDPLASFLSNSALKAEYGLYFLLLSDMTRIKTLSDFMKKAEEILYNTTNIMNLDPDTLHARYKDANVVLDNLIKHSRSVVYGLKKDKDKGKEMDKLQMLLGSIPTDKLKDIIKSLR